MTAAVRRNDPEFFFEGQNSSRYIEKTAAPLGPRRRSRRLKGQNSDFCIFGRRAAPAASAEGASMAGRAPQARGCSITRRGEQQNKIKKKTGAQRLLQARSACCER